MTLLTVEQAAERYHTSRKAIHDKTRARVIPMLKRAGFRRVLLPVAWLDAWDEGAELEVSEGTDGTVMVRPKSVVAALAA